MKRYTWALAAVLVTVALLAVHLPAQNQGALQRDLGNGLAEPAGVTVNGTVGRGVVFRTAAINADGTIAGCFRCNKTATFKLSPGVYQVVFDENVQAVNGWSRWVQADTLQGGSGNAWCNTADRVGVPDGIFVNCQHATSTGPVPVDTSFFIFVAR